MGYWNEFAPIFDYSSVNAHADNIQKYVDRGLLKAPSELYYPIRLKPRGDNSLEALRRYGVDHIELRMFDLNPLAEVGGGSKGHTVCTVIDGLAGVCANRSSDAEGSDTGCAEFQECSAL